MTAAQLWRLLQDYGADCLLLALPVCALTALCKLKWPAKQKKFLTFVPFLFGTAAVICAEAVRQGGFSMLPYAELCADGVRCGGIATVLYVAYEQFLRKRRALPDSPAEIAVTGILAPRVQEARLAPLAAAITAEITPGADEGAATARLGELLKEDIPDESERAAVGALILAVIRAL